PGPRPGPRPAPPRADRNSRPGDGRPGPARGGTTTAVAPEPPRSSAQIQLVETTEAAAVTTADETVDRLLDEGRAPSDVLVLTTGDPHPWAQHELSFGEDAYWRQQAEGDDVFAAHAASVGRTDGRPVVVLAVNGGTDEEVAAALPAALAKAGTQLIVCGEAGRLRALL
ncbi:hypothetical protein, partial [Streptomyces alkaliterrae]